MLTPSHCVSNRESDRSREQRLETHCTLKKDIFKYWVEKRTTKREQFLITVSLLSRISTFIFQISELSKWISPPLLGKNACARTPLGPSNGYLSPCWISSHDIASLGVPDSCLMKMRPPFSCQMPKAASMSRSKSNIESCCVYFMMPYVRFVLLQLEPYNTDNKKPMRNLFRDENKKSESNGWCYPEQHIFAVGCATFSCYGFSRVVSVATNEQDPWVRRSPSSLQRHASSPDQACHIWTSSKFALCFCRDNLLKTISCHYKHQEVSSFFQ